MKSPSAKTQSKGTKFALAGLGGYITPKHLGALRANECDLICAFAESDSVGVIDSYYPDCEVFTDKAEFFDFIEASSISHISIITPNFTHKDFILKSLGLNLSVICEKPLVIAPFELDEIQSALESANKRAALSGAMPKFVATVLQLRYMPSIKALQEKIAGELVKNPSRHYAVELSFMTLRGRWFFKSWKGDSEKSGGLALLLGVHFLDILLLLFGRAKGISLDFADKKTIDGRLEFANASVHFIISIDSRLLPDSKTSKRTFSIDGEDFELIDKGVDAFSALYSEALSGRGFGIDTARPAIELGYQITKMAENFGQNSNNLVEQETHSTADFHSTQVESSFDSINDTTFNGTVELISPNFHSTTLIHKTAIIESTASIGAGTKVWAFTRIGKHAKVGANCTIGQGVVIGDNVRLGSGVKIGDSAKLYDGVVIEDEVFIGPSVVFTNISRPRAFFSQRDAFVKTLVQRGATIGSNTTIICGSTIGEYALIGAASLVTHDIAPFTLAFGSPAREIGRVDKRGQDVKIDSTLVESKSRSE